MAEIKITSLAAISDPASTDVLPIVDVSADITNKISIADLLKNATTGSASNPSFAFDGDSNTGMYRSGADALAFSTGGTGRLFIDSSGNVGINGTSSLAQLHITNPSGTNGFYLSRTTGTAIGDQPSLHILADSSKSRIYGYGDALTFWTAATGVAASERMQIDSLGRVGIGTSSPTGYIHIEGESNGTETYGRFTTGPALGDQSLVIKSGSSRDHMAIQVKTNAGAVDDLSLQPDGGKVGVGTSSPAYKFDCRGEAAIDLYNGSGGGGVLNFRPALGDANKFNMSISSYDHSGEGTGPADGVSINGYDGVSICTGDQTAREERLRVTQGGNVGIGTASPSGSLHVDAASGVDGPIFDSGGAGNTNHALLVRDSSNSQLLRVNNNGNVGIGTSSPSYKLHLAGTGDVQTKTSNGTAAIRFGITSGNEGIINLETGHDLTLHTNNTEHMRIDSSGNVGISESSPSTHSAGAGLPSLILKGNSASHTDRSGAVVFVSQDGGTTGKTYLYHSGTTFFVQSQTATSIQFKTDNTDRLHIGSSGNVGIGTTSVDFSQFGSNTGGLAVEDVGGTNTGLKIGDGSNHAYLIAAGNGNFYISSYGGGDMQFATDGTERMRIDSSGRLLVGTTSSSTNDSLVLNGNSSGSAAPSTIRMRRTGAISANTEISLIEFASTATRIGGSIRCYADDAWSTGDTPGRLVFSTTAATDSSPTERMRITNDGHMRFGQTTTSTPGLSNTTSGIGMRPAGEIFASVSGAPSAYFNRNSNDGSIVSFRQAGAEEGSISVSGTTVSYNGAHLSRWSQLPGGATRIEIFRGTVLSNLDEMCEWGEEDNEQLNRMKVSDVEGDRNVAGVFQAWDDDDDTYTNDFYCAMTGDFVIRIAQGTTVARGDLLMSAGDGTAKPQDDDIIRSKTIAKVTSTNVSCTYDDGSYCVPCVLMAC